MPSGQSFEDVLRSHGSLSAIPDDVLKQHGFTRLGDGRVVKDSRVAEVIARESVQEQHIPFTTITFTGERTQHLHHDVTPRARQKILAALEIVDQVTSGDVHDMARYCLGKGKGVGVFIDALLSKDVQKSVGVLDPVAYESFVTLLFAVPLDALACMVEEVATAPVRAMIEEQDALETEVHEDAIVASRKQWTEDVVRTLARAKAQCGDREYYAGKFDQCMHSPATRLYGGYTDMADVATQFADATVFTCMQQVFAAVCDSLRLPEIAEHVRSATTIEDMAHWSPALASVEEKERTIKADIRTATGRERELLSATLADARRARKAAQQICMAIGTYIHMPVTFASHMSTTLGKVENMLVRGGTTREHVQFTCIGTPDKEKDADPGAMSGDCTKGKPLPFDSPSLPLYNVKVHSGEAKKYIGNIYLFVTTVGTPPALAWHLDAIQIPAHVDWDDAIEHLFASMRDAARAKGVKCITVSREREHMSNYDYIATAVDAFVRRHGCGHGQLHNYTLHVPNTRSELQTTGDVWVIPV